MDTRADKYFEHYDDFGERVRLLPERRAPKLEIIQLDDRPTQDDTLRATALKANDEIDALNAERDSLPSHADIGRHFIYMVEQQVRYLRHNVERLSQDDLKRYRTSLNLAAFQMREAHTRIADLLAAS